MESNRDLTKICKITRIGSSGRSETEDILLREDRWQLYCNGQMVSVHNCLSLDIEQLAVGQLCYQGLIQSASQIASVQVDGEQKQIDVKLRPVEVTAPAIFDAESSFTAADIHRLQQEFNKKSGLFRRTGSAHSCALVDNGGILAYFEDVARHNAMDKLLGGFLLNNMDAAGKALFFSGRLALDMLEKSILTGVKVLVSPGAPTLSAVEAAQAHGLTMLGFVRSDNINIYTNPQRIV